MIKKKNRPKKTWVKEPTKSAGEFKKWIQVQSQIDSIRHNTEL